MQRPTQLASEDGTQVVWFPETSTQVVWFPESWNMSEVRSAWPCLAKTALAQLALLQAMHSHIGGSHYSFSLPSGTDSSATEAGINKPFSALLLQLVATWAHAHNVHLQPTHVPGRLNDWADDRLRRFMNRPANRVRFSPRSLAQAGRGLALCPIDVTSFRTMCAFALSGATPL